MIKLFILAIIFVIFCIIKLLLVLIGIISVGTNKRSTLINFAYQHIKNAKKVSIILYPYIPQLVDDILVISKQNNWGIVEEIDFLQIALSIIVQKIDYKEMDFLHTRLENYNNIKLVPLSVSFSTSFCQKYSIT